MKRTISLAILGLIFVFTILPILLIATSAHAQQITPNSVCGEVATGRRSDDGSIVANYKAGNFYVNAQGFWALCPSVHGSDAPAPKKDCLPERGRVWEVDGNVCSSTQSGQGAGIPGGPHGKTWVTAADIGSTRGALALRCVDGQWQDIGSSCYRAQTCPAHTRIQIAATGYVTLNALTTPTEGTVLALPADPDDTHTGAAVLRCQYGGWAFVEPPVWLPK